jgi:hypothetical protein
MKKWMMLSGLLMPVCVQAELLGNGDFEAQWDPETDTGPGYAYTPDQSNAGLSWAFYHGSGLSKSHTDWGGVAYEGEQFSFLQRGGYFTQTVTLAERAALNLSYAWGSRPNYPTEQGLSVLFAGNEVQFLSADTAQWTRESLSLGVVDPGEYLLQFQGVPLSSADVAVFVDGVSLIAEPDPYTVESGAYAVNGVAGFSVLLTGLAFWRRKRLSAVQ